VPPGVLPIKTDIARFTHSFCCVVRLTDCARHSTRRITRCAAALPLSRRVRGGAVPIAFRHPLSGGAGTGNRAAAGKKGCLAEYVCRPPPADRALSIPLRPESPIVEQNMPL